MMTSQPAPRFLALTRAFVSGIQGVAAILLLVAVVLNFSNIVGRYAFSEPIFWAEEIMLYLLVGIVFLGNSAVGWEGKQLRMDVLLQILPPAMRNGFEALADLAVVVVSISLMIMGWPAVAMLAEFDQRSQAAEIPLVIPQMLIPIGFALISIFVIIRLIYRLCALRDREVAS